MVSENKTVEKHTKPIENISPDTEKVCQLRVDEEKPSVTNRN